MLVLSRKRNQSIMVGDDVEIVIVSVDRDQVKLGIKAPREIAVHRSEVYLEIKQANEAAVNATKEQVPSVGATAALLTNVQGQRLQAEETPAAYEVSADS